MGFWDFLPGVSAAKKAGKTIGAATKKSNKEIDAFRELILPNITGGNDAFNMLLGYGGVRGRGVQQDLYDNFETDPGFQAATDFGVDNIMQRGHAMGLGKSGGTREDVGTFASRMLQSAYGDRMNRLMQMAGFGQNSAAQYGNATNQIANNTMQGANAQAGYQMQAGNSATSAINTALGLGAFGAGGGFGGGALFGGSGAYGSPSTALPVSTSSYTMPTFNNKFGTY